MTVTRHHFLQACALLVLGVLLLTSGCSRPPKKRQFNNILAKRNAKMAAAAKEFYKAVEPLSKGQAAGPVRQKLDECKTALEEAQSYVGAPRGTEAGRALLNTYKDYVAAQQKIYDECLTPILAIVEDNRRFPAPGQKWAAIQPLLQKADEIERPAYAELNKAQQTYGQAHGFQPK